MNPSVRKNKQLPTSKAAELRSRAEAQMWGPTRNSKSNARATQSAVDSRRLVQELQVHQMELEMQNAELQETQDRNEVLLEKYSELYDFAPVGYFTLATDGTIRMVNLTGTNLVEVNRSRLVGQPFRQLLSTEHRSKFDAFLKGVFAGQSEKVGAFKLLSKNQLSRLLSIEAQRSPDGRECRAIVSDISDRQRGEDQLRLLWESGAVMLTTDDPEAMLRRLFTKIGPALEVDVYFHYMVDTTGADLRLASFAGIPEETTRSIERLKFGQGLCGTVALTRHPLHATHIQQSDDPRARFVKSLGIRAFASNPLIADNVLVGTLSYARRSGEQFAPDELAVLQSISSHVAVAYQRLRSASALRESEVRYRRLFETANDGVLLLDPCTRKITDANPFMTTLLGYPNDQLVGKELCEIGLLKNEHASQSMFKKLNRKHAARYEHLPLKTTQGRHQEVEMVANLYWENDHEVIQCNIRDITARRKADEILRRNEELFSALIEQSPVGVYVVDSQLRVRQANPTARSAFSKINPLKGRAFSEITHIVWPKRLADEIMEHFVDTLKTGKPYHSPDFCARRHDTGKKEGYEWQIQRITLPDSEKGVVCFFSNITDRKRLEETQRRAEVLAASNQKLLREIVHRKTVEEALNRSDQHQRKLVNRSRQMQRQLRLMSHRILMTQEEERKQISRELHDVIVQTLTGINIRLAALKKDASLSRKGFDRNLARTQNLVETSVRIVHEFARNLRPTALDDLGLIPALHSFMKTFSAESGVRTRLTAYAGVEKLSTAKRTALFRVAQEALTNVARHAQASHAEVRILKVMDGICMKISDDGKCFDVDQAMQAQKGNRLGLLGMRERLEMVGGSLKVECTAGRGTTIITRIPIGKSRKRAPASLAT